MKSVVLIALAFAVSCAFADPSGDRITSLPGLPPINFTHYAGYITVDEAHGRKLFYWFVESQRDPANDKLVLWLNGGPGCSSIGGGLMTENGPFRVNSDGKTISINPNSWNRVANVLYLESPAGVGFSYSDDSDDYNVGDARTANDAYVFLQQFLTEFPEYRQTPFWISGESYGGHYVPELADRILYGNAAGDQRINLQGIMVGNAWTYMPIDNAGAVFYWWSHALISDDTYNNIMSTCNFTDIGPLKARQEGCDDYLNDANAEMGNVNIYDIYVDVCTASRPKKVVEQLARAGSPVHKILAEKHAQINPPYQPCADTFTSNYLNTPSVQQAIHANISYQWDECSGLVNYNYSDVEKSVMPLYDEFLKAGIYVLVYSGDVDAIVPYSGSRQWISNLKRPVISSWTPYTVNQQVGGYVQVLKGLTFATVRNAGHMVPETQPERAYYMFSNFLYNYRL